MPRKHFVTFLSPGTFVSEQTTKPVDSWDTREATSMAKQIRERYGATPYGFCFTTYLTADPVPDGEGGFLKVIPKEVEHSGTYFLGGELRTIDQVQRENLQAEKIPLSNMESNDWPIVVQSCNSYRITQPFEEKDFIVDPEGRILFRGDDPALIAYRRDKIAQHRRKLEAALTGKMEPDLFPHGE